MEQLLQQRAISESIRNAPTHVYQGFPSTSSSSSSPSSSSSSQQYMRAGGSGSAFQSHGSSSASAVEVTAQAEADFMGHDDEFEAALLSLFGDSYDFGKLFNIRPFVYQQSKNRHQIIQCGSCDSSYSILSQHVNHVPCKCGAYVLQCRPHTIDDCRAHMAAVHLHVKMKSTITQMKVKKAKKKKVISKMTLTLTQTTCL
jgi:hypothetical protein